MWALKRSWVLTELNFHDDTCQIYTFNPFHATCLFQYPLEIKENRRFSDAFREDRKIPVTWGRLIKVATPELTITFIWGITYPCTQDVNITYTRHYKDVLNVFWTSYVRSIYVLCSEGSGFNPRYFSLKNTLGKTGDKSD